jgi:hypothetical protein
MKKLLIPAAALALASAAAITSAQEGVALGEAKTVQAVVQAIDLPDGEVVLKVPATNEAFSVDVAPGVNLSNLQVGDTITAKYYEAVVLSVSPPGAKTAGEKITATHGNAPGQLTAVGGGVVTEKVQLTATIDAISKSKDTITVTGALGDKRHLKVKDPSVLKDFKVGDSVTLTLSEALVVDFTSK